MIRVSNKIYPVFMSFVCFVKFGLNKTTKAVLGLGRIYLFQLSMSSIPILEYQIIEYELQQQVQYWYT